MVYKFGLLCRIRYLSKMTLPPKKLKKQNQKKTMQKQIGNIQINIDLIPIISMIWCNMINFDEQGVYLVSPFTLVIIQNNNSVPITTNDIVLRTTYKLREQVGSDLQMKAIAKKLSIIQITGSVKPRDGVTNIRSSSMLLLIYPKTVLK